MERIEGLIEAREQHLGIARNRALQGFFLAVSALAFQFLSLAESAPETLSIPFINLPLALRPGSLVLLFIAFVMGILALLRALRIHDITFEVEKAKARAIKARDDDAFARICALEEIADHKRAPLTGLHYSLFWPLLVFLISATTLAVFYSTPVDYSVHGHRLELEDGKGSTILGYAALSASPYLTVYLIRIWTEHRHWHDLLKTES
ncbi:MAG TPA: hypothetical protein EYP07_13345 [Kiloniellaceae bacterium]|nr:hypothetical protein [Kiloniellaceae bacterium]